MQIVSRQASWDRQPSARLEVQAITVSAHLITVKCTLAADVDISPTESVLERGPQMRQIILTADHCHVILREYHAIVPFLEFF